MLIRHIALIAVAGVMWQPAVKADIASDVDSIFSKWTAGETPGCAVGVAHKDATLKRAYGAADLERNVKNTVDTVFDAASVGKQFTAAAILLLAQEGKLSLTDDVRKYIPELPNYGATIQIDHLLRHTSGLREWQMLARFTGWPLGTRQYAQSDVLDLTRRQKSLNFLPGDEVSYSSTGYILLGLVVDRVADESFFSYTRKRLFERLGMRNTQWRENVSRIVKNRAIAYSRGAGGYVQDMPFENTYGSGGLQTTVGDLLIWNEALTSRKLGVVVTEGLQERALLNNRQPSVYGRGLVVTTFRGVDELSHGGGDQGYRSWLARYPSQELSIALLCNAADANVDTLAHKVAELYLPSSEPKVTNTVPATDQAALAGTYAHSRTGFPLTLRVVNEGIRASNGASLTIGDLTTLKLGEFNLASTSENSFRLTSPLGTVVDDYHRVDTQAPNLAEFVGTYVSDEIGMTYFVSIGEGRLILKFDRRPLTRIVLTPAYRDAFAPGNILVRFFRDKQGKVTELSLATERLRDLRVPRITVQ